MKKEYFALTKSLNGWQRVWILISFLYAMVALTLMIDAKPAPPEYVLYKSFETGWRSRAVIINPDTGKPVQTMDVRMPDGRLIKEVSVNTPKATVMERYQKIKSEETRQFFLKITLLTFLPPLFFYFLGWSVGWVYRGFQRKANND